MATTYVASDHRRQPNWNRFRSLLPVGIVVAVAIGAAIAIYPILAGDQSGGTSKLTTGFSFALAVLLAVMPAVICTVQNVSLRRQRSELEALEGSAVTDTTLYFTAQRMISADAGEEWIDNDYIVPSFVYFLVCFIGFLAIFLGYTRHEMFDPPTIFLGGLMDPAAETYTMYQRGTFCVVAMAMAGAYAYALGRILDRINNNDLYPVSLYYYAARVIIACVVATVLRHSIQVFDVMAPEGTDTALNPLLLLLGFIVGFTPDLFIIAISRKAFQVIKVWGSRSDPADAVMPSALPLLMIDDLTREKVDRLNEIGIDNAQVLAHQNPFLMLPRLPYELSLIVDWISQAQLYALVRDERLKALRGVYVRNIIDLYVRLKNETANQPVCEALGMDASAAPALIQQLEADAYFMQLKQLVEALHPAQRPRFRSSARPGPETARGCAP
jgi:hypothetical protein